MTAGNGNVTRETVIAGLFAVATLLGAFLLFFVQPMAAKQLLPSYGGSPSTWGAALVFFQVALLCGYTYAHVTSELCSPRTQAGLHLLLVVVCVLMSLWLPALAGVQLPAPNLRWPPLAIAWQLSQQIGARYFLLSCTAPLLQRWFALVLGRPPYALYALSNVGSLAALLAYPFVVEPLLALPQQDTWFGRGFLLEALLLTACAALLIVRAPRAAVPLTGALGGVRVLRWLVLAGLPSALLLAVTQHITTDVAATPLFWVLPLALYLSTYVLAFSSFGVPARARTVVLASFVVACVLLGWSSFAEGSASLPRQLAGSLGVLFCGSLLCHDALARSRPEPFALTRFYLCIAAAGALGAVLVSLVAPLVFDDYYELELSALAVFGAMLGLRASLSAGQRQLLFLGIGVAVPLLAAALVLRAGGETKQGTIVERRRSFLGPLRVTALPEGRVLTHGRIRHGMQLTTKGMTNRPTMYFGPGTALARVMERHHSERARRIAVLGLGVGTIAAYGRRGDALRFYELDPEVASLARHDFTFLGDTPASVQIVIGDGRLWLAREPAQRLDVLAIDAFSSDAVPVHLLTREAFAVYARQLAPDGILLSNVSNRHLEVERVAEASARANGLSCRVIETPADVTQFVSKVRWAVMARDPKQLDTLLEGLPPFPRRGPELLWTDARASVLPILR